MSRVIKVPLSTAGIETAIKELKEYQNDWLPRKASELAKRLSEYGMGYAQIGFARAVYDGPRNVSVSVEPRSENRYAVIASGKEVLFIEFGAGVRYGYGHPDAGKYGMGPGTYPIPPGEGRWNDPDGWNIPKRKGGGHTFGNPPSMTMYRTAKDLRDSLERIARDVFGQN